MSDIVERLRWRAESTSAPTATTPMLCAEAADTITALRAENERLREALFTAISVLPEKDAENERLRAALESAEGNFYNMANAIDDADYRGAIPGLDGIVVGHFEEYHKGHVGWLVKYAEETRAALTTQDKTDV